MHFYAQKTQNLHLTQLNFCICISLHSIIYDVHYIPRYIFLVTQPGLFEEVESGKFMYLDEVRRTDAEASRFCDEHDSFVATLDEESDLAFMVNKLAHIPLQFASKKTIFLSRRCCLICGSIPIRGGFQ